MNKLLLGFLCICTSYSLYGQAYATDKVELFNNETAIVLDQWTTYFENSDFKIEYIESFCDVNSGPDFNAIHMRFTNLTSQNITLSWYIELDYNNDCKTCNSDEYERLIDLAANEVFETTCDMDEANNKFRIFQSFQNREYSTSVLTAFKLSGLIQGTSSN